MPVEINNKVYKSLKQAVNTYGININTVKFRCNPGNNNYPEWRFLTEAEAKKIAQSNLPKPVSVESVIYDSVLECAKVYRVQ